jgi:glutathione S-transferase
MECVAVVTAVALLEYFFFAVQTGRARVRTGLKAPATTGSPEFERYYRVQANTVEQMVLFLPGIWMFAHYVSPLWAAGLGTLFVIGRGLYYASYTVNPDGRGLGFGLSVLPNLALVIGGLIGALCAAFAS